jgi:CPA1 family monovalent cation:H+ antiporter
MTCGHVGCCESTRGHARAHALAEHHPLIRELPIRERAFTWCYDCNAYLE